MKEDQLKYKEGDWVRWFGMSPATGQIVTNHRENHYRLKVYGSLTSHNDCHYSHLRLATEGEILAAGGIIEPQYNIF